MPTYVVYGRVKYIAPVSLISFFFTRGQVLLSAHPLLHMCVAAADTVEWHCTAVASTRPCPKLPSSGRMLTNHQPVHVLTVSPCHRAAVGGMACSARHNVRCNIWSTHLHTEAVKHRAFDFSCWPFPCGWQRVGEIALPSTTSFGAAQILSLLYGCTVIDSL